MVHEILCLSDLAYSIISMARTISCRLLDGVDLIPDLDDSCQLARLFGGVDFVPDVDGPQLLSNEHYPKGRRVLEVGYNQSVAEVRKQHRQCVVEGNFKWQVDK